MRGNHIFDPELLGHQHFYKCVLSVSASVIVLSAIMRYPFRHQRCIKVSRCRIVTTSVAHVGFIPHCCADRSDRLTRGTCRCRTSCRPQQLLNFISLNSWISAHCNQLTKRYGQCQFIVQPIGGSDHFLCR